MGVKVASEKRAQELKELAGEVIQTAIRSSLRNRLNQVCVMVTLFDPDLGIQTNAMVPALRLMHLSEKVMKQIVNSMAKSVMNEVASPDAEWSEGMLYVGKPKD